jgi:hypothetical protein
MAQFRYQSIADCYVFEPGFPEGQLDVDKQGWAYDDSFFRTFNTYAKEGLVERDSTLGEFMKARLISNAIYQRVICTPYAYNANAGTLSDIANWDIVGTATWAQTTNLDPSIEGIATKRFMNVNASGLWGGLKSKGTVPKLASWSVVIRRYTPKNSLSIHNCASYIEFGDYLLYFPYNQPISLWKNVDASWQKLKDIELITDPTTDDEGKDLIILNFINLNGILFFSGNWFNDFDYYQETDDLEPAEYKITVSHIGSSWHMNFYPTKEKQCIFSNIKIPVYYATDLDYIFEKVGKKEPTGTSIIVEDNPNTPSTDTEVYYQVTMTPTVLTGGYYVTPELEGVIVKHKPVVNKSPTPYINLAAPTGVDNGDGERLYSIQGEESIDFDSASWSIVLDNEDAALSDPDNTALFLKPFRVIKLKAGFKEWDNSIKKKTIFTGVVITPTFGAYETGKNIVETRLASLSWLCQQTFNKGDWPIFDGWTIKDALEWLALRCRISVDRHQFYINQIEDPDNPGNFIDDPNAPLLSALSKGIPTEPLWMATVLQTSAWELMKKIADWIKYDLYFDRVGNLVCQPKKFVWDGTANHHFFASITNELTGIEKQSFNIATNIQLTMMGEEYYNTVYIGGFNILGGAISTFKTDIDSIYLPSNPNYMGFEKAIAISYETALEVSKTTEIANSIFFKFLMYPKKVSFKTYFNPDILPNDVLKISGSKHKIIGSTGDNVRYYRICTLSHSISVNGVSTTEIIADYLGNELEAAILRS